MKIVDVDENGLGPLLGPLVTTAVTVETARYSQKRHGALGRELGIDDSKNTAGFGRMAVAEGLTLALLSPACGRVCADVDELFGALLLDARDALTRPCPDSTRSQCWSRPLALPCFGGDVTEGREMLRKLARRGVEVTHVRSALACTGVLNTLLSRGQSRVEVDLELMERLVLDAREKADEELAAICGMVGGIRNYLAKMRHFPLRGVAALKVPRPTLAFAVTGVGKVSFEIDADAHHMPVALASMVGKYVRELWMARQNRFYLEHDASLEEVSGYHDPVTQRFIGATVQLRAKLGIVDDCFVRKAAKHLPVDDRQLALLEE
jgi:ribonuclease HII